jgi:soluble lytic murein transglycosylase-like protein
MATANSTQQMIQAQAVAAGVDPGIALAVAQVESGFNQSAVSPSGAIGVFQLLASTATGLSVNPNDINGNIQGGIAYLSQMYETFNGYWPDALAAYNWGPGNVQAAGSGNYPASVQNYVNNVLNLAAGYDQTTVAALAAPSIGAEVLGAVNLGSLDPYLPTTTLGYTLWAVGGVLLLSWIMD